MKTKSSLKINILMSISYKVLTLFVPLITTPYLSRVLGAEGIGIYSYEYSISYYFILFIQLGLENYGNRSIAEVSGSKEKRSKRFCEIFAVQLLNSLLFVILFVLYVSLFSQNKLMSWIMLGFVLSSAFDITWYFYGIEYISATVLRNIIIKFSSLALIFAFVKESDDLFIYAIIMSLGTLLSQVILWAMLPNSVKFVKVGICDIKKHVRSLLILFIPVLAVSLYRVMDKIMLGIMSTKLEVGYYESAERVVQLPIQIINAFGVVMMPRIANLLADGKEEKTRKYLNISMKVMMLLCAFMSFGIMAVAKEFVPSFYGNGYEKCVFLFDILLPSTWFLCFSNVLRTQYLIPQKKDLLFIVSIFSGAFVNIILNCLLIKTLGSIGAAIGTLAAEAVVCIVQIIGVRKELPIRKYLRISSICIFVGGIMFIIVNQVPLLYDSIFITLLVKIGIGVVLAIIPALILLKNVQHEGEE